MIYDMFECDNLDSCLLYLNRSQRNICYNHDQITDNQGIVRHQARQTRPNSGGVAEGHPRFDKGGVAIIFYFLLVKNRTF